MYINIKTTWELPWKKKNHAAEIPAINNTRVWQKISVTKEGNKKGAKLNKVAATGEKARTLNKFKVPGSSFKIVPRDNAHENQSVD